MSGRSALLVIDVQANMFDRSRPVADSDRLLERLSRLIDAARRAQLPVIFIRNCGEPGQSDEPGTPGWELHSALQVAEDDPVLDKTTGNAFASTPLDSELKARGVTRVVIAGLQSEYCIRDTTFGALSLGYSVTLVTDAHSTFDGDGETGRQIAAAVNAEMRDQVELLRTDTFVLK